ncbi:MAG: DUF5717 family protein [Lachnospiraceae bacterium]|nr:DUF5717 family protein [Lachnospiraceae bacterium]
MKRRIEQLLNGRFAYEVPAFIASESQIVLKIPEGRNQKGEFSVGAEDGSRVKGVVTSDNHRIVLAKDRFHGSTSKIVYGIDTQGLKNGDVIRGKIVLSSGIGELQIPVTAEIAKLQVQSSMGAVRTLDDFTKLAIKDQREAFHLFTSEHFSGILNGKNCVYTALYKGMSHNPVTYQHMEEFLIAAKKKDAITLSLDKQQKRAYQVEHSLKDTLYVYKSTWGYVRMEIETVGDFLEVDKKVVTSDDFIGSVYGLEFVVHKEMLGQGRHYGKIIIRNVHQTLEFEIEASVAQGMQLLPQGLKKHKITELSRDYIDLHLHNMDYRTWYENSKASLLELTRSECMDTMLVLYEAYLFLMNEEVNQAMELLWNFKQGKVTLTKPRELGIYYFLAKQVDLLPAEQSNILPKIRAYAQQEPADYYLLAIRLQLDETLRASMIMQLHAMEQAFVCGCKSPFLYLDAYQILTKQESLLRRLSPFTIQVLSFARKHRVLSKSLLQRAAYLSDNLKEFDSSIYQLLKAGYEQYPSDEVLEAICKLVMKGTPTRKEYFRWYALAVEHEIRITRLYEYYIETMGEDYHGMLPQVIRMYFAYNNTLSATRKAFVYANVIRNKETDSTTYNSYVDAMEKFAASQVLKRRMNEDFAELYREFIHEPQDAAMAQALSDVLFVHRIILEDRNIRRVIVCHNALQSEQVYPVNDQCAYVNIYSEDARILFEDEKRRRFGTTVAYKDQQLMDNRDLARQCGAYGKMNPGLLLNICRELPSQMDVNSKSLPLYQMAEHEETFTEEYRDVIRKKLLEYYMAHTGETQLEDILGDLDVNAYARVDKAATVEVLVTAGLYTDAFSIVSRYGVEGIELSVLMKLASRMILRIDFEEDEELVFMADYVMRCDCYDEVILTYLRNHYVGSMAAMCSLWKNLKGFQLDTYRLDERILIFSMFVRCFPQQGEKILDGYIRGQGREQVVQAYLTYVSCTYFMTGEQGKPVYFDYLERMYEREWEMETICHLALLKYYSSLEKLTERQEQQARALLLECTQMGLRFAFFQKLPVSLIQAYQVEDKVFVEEHFPADSKVVIHYSLQQRNLDRQVFISEPMRNMYQGIFTKEFLLFYGETLTYYLTVEHQGENRTTPQKEITLPGVEASGKTYYKLLNQILAARALGSRDEEQKALTVFLQQQKLVDSAFHMMD